MHSKHEAKAVSVAASLITTAIAVLRHSGESIGIGIRTDAERSLQRLGPDHEVDVVDQQALRGMLAAKYGEDFAVDVFDNNAPQPRTTEQDQDERFAKLEQLATQSIDENARLRAELDALKKEKSEAKVETPPKPKPGEQPKP